jgi:hypothetical protein
MQFDYSHKIGSDYATVAFRPHRVKGNALYELCSTFLKLGGEMEGDVSHWKFPHYITTDILLLVIDNTCFNCGGLMKDAIVKVKIPTTFRGEIAHYEQDVEVRQCSTCKHSHT